MTAKEFLIGRLICADGFPAHEKSLKDGYYEIDNIANILDEYVKQFNTSAVSNSNLKSLIDQYFEENLISKFSAEYGEFVKEIIRDFVKNYYH